jgi:signal transduction histidine kinase
VAKLKPRARLIRTIGDKLISGPEAAIIELVKNSYDADSTSVEIKITPPSPLSGGVISVRDTGHGMTFENIINDWLEPATDAKSTNKTSRSGVRTVLGAKGVGRFASASLGRTIKLTSIAKYKDQYQTSTLNLDWSIFESNKYLDDIDIDVTQTLSTERLKTGVLVEICNLSTIWDKKKINNLIRELRRLATPNHVPNKFDIYLYLDDFKLDLEHPYNFDGPQFLFESNRMAEVLQKQSIAATSTSLIQAYSINEESDYHLRGSFDSSGTFIGEFSIVRGDNLPMTIFVDAPSLEYGELSCGSVDVELKLFDLEKDSIDKLFQRMGLNFSDFGLRKARAIVNENSGVAIYRSGFRIRPYGEPDNDWLKLEQRRVQEPSKKIGHGQISGSIHVHSEDESNLVERSSREGLETNSAFDRLIYLITNVLVKIEQKRFDFRVKAGISRKPIKNIEKARDIASLASLTKAIENLSPEEQKPLLLKIEKESQALTKTLDEIDAYQKLLESRAALGMVVAQVLHDGRTYLEPINSSAKSIIDKAPFLLETSKKGEVVRKHYPTYGQAIKTGARGLASLFKSLDPISGRRRGRPVNFLVLDSVNNSLNLLEEDLIENGISVEIDLIENTMIHGYSGDFQSAMMNIIQNAIHWLSIIEVEERIISISAQCESNIVKISIKNNGPLIDVEEFSSIFEAGFSLKTNGHGLGLAIAREACRHSNGDLYLSINTPETDFIIEFPIAQKDTV